MKKCLFILVVSCFVSVAQAQSSSVALRFGVPYLVSVAYEYDFEAANKGFGIRGYLGASYVFATGLFGVGIEGLYRLPLGDAGSSFHFGLGAGGGITLFQNPSLAIPNPPSSSSAGVGGLIYLYGHFGFELIVAPNIAFVIEVQPIGAFWVNGINFYTLPIFSLGSSYRF